LRRTVRALVTLLVVALAAGTTTAAGASPSRADKRAPAKRPVSVSLASSSYSLPTGSTAVLSVRLRPAGPGVTLQRLQGGRWVTDQTARSARSGRYGFSVRSSGVATNSYRAVSGATTKLRRGTSQAVTVGWFVPPPPPGVTLALPRDADQGAALPFSYTSSNVPGGAQVVLQRRMGTAASWGTVQPLTATPTGSGSAPGLPLGQYAFRIAVLDGAGKVLAVQEAATVTVWGNVPLTVILGRSDGRTVIANGHTFNYIDAEYNKDQVINEQRTTCRLVHLDLARPDASGSSSGDPSSPMIATVVQQTRDPVSTPVGNNSITALQAGVVPGQTWAFNVRPSNSSSSWYVYYNGFANCYSTQG